MDAGSHGSDDGPARRTRMFPNSTDPTVLLAYSRERAATLREDWASANDTKVCRLSSFVEQCRAVFMEPFDRARLHRGDIPWRVRRSSSHFPG